MEILQSCFVPEEDLLDFTLDGAGGAEEAVGPTFSKPGLSASYSSGESAASFGGGTEARLFPEFVEEELEWLSNKDAFPAVETCFGILSDNPELVSNNNNNNNQSPVSVLENSSGSSNNTSGGPVASCCTSLKVPANYPVRARTKRSRRRRRAGFADIFCPWMPRVSNNNKKRDFSVMSRPAPVASKNGGAGGIGRRCLHCQTDKTPQWRAGPNGPKTLCNACGVRYKSGRLLPEYRPANSPTFSSTLHSNSHRKVVEMRKQKEVGPGVGVTEVNVAASPCGYSVG